MATIFKRNDRGPYVIQYFDSQGKRREHSSRTTDLGIAKRIAAKLEGNVALRREGIVDARQDHFQEENRKSLTQHVADYLAHCKRIGRAVRHVQEKERHLRELIEKTGATRLSNLTADLVEGNLHLLSELGLSARTVNFRRQVSLTFLNWCVKVGRIESNPLVVVPRLDENRDRKRVRRPLTEEELARLFEVAEKRGRKAWYMLAALAGLRKGELQRLTWADIDLDRAALTVRDGKSRNLDVIPLCSQLRDYLRSIKLVASHPNARVFPTVVTDLTRQKDFQRAGIALEDNEGRVADLHSLRATLATRLALAGTPPQLAQKIMRHSDYRVTLKHYTILGIEDTARALEKLSEIGKPITQAATGTFGFDPQQFPQHSEREIVQNRAKRCESGGGMKPVPKPSQLLLCARESDAVRDKTMVHPEGVEPPTFRSEV